MKKSELRQLIREEYQKTLNELEFPDKKSFDTYNSSHKMRASTQVTIAGKKTTVGAQSEPSHGDPKVNKEVMSLASKHGVTPEKLGKEEYTDTMYKSVVAALTDANFHSEVRKLVAVIEGDPKLANDPAKEQTAKNLKFGTPEYDKWVKNTAWGSEYMVSDKQSTALGRNIAQQTDYSYEDIRDAAIYTLRMNGAHKAADLIQKTLK